MGIDASDVRSFAAHLSAEADSVGPRASQVVRATAARVEGDAKIMAPVDTGALRNSIGTTITGDGRYGAMTAEVGPTVNYGVYLELGTTRARAQPFLFPAADRHEPAFWAAMNQIITL